MPMPEFKSASFRLTNLTPRHATYGVWINGGKSGNLVVTVDERDPFERMMQRAGFEHMFSAEHLTANRT